MREEDSVDLLCKFATEVTLLLSEQNPGGSQRRWHREALSSFSLKVSYKDSPYLGVDIFVNIGIIGHFRNELASCL